MTPIEKRIKLAELKEKVKDKVKNFMAYIPMRDKLYYGISVDEKKSVKDVFGAEIADKVKYKDKVK